MSSNQWDIEELEEGDAWLETDEVVSLDVKQPLDVALQVRLPGDKWEILRQEAAELGVEPSTLLRIWVFERLRAVRQTRSSA